MNWQSTSHRYNAGGGQASHALLVVCTNSETVLVAIPRWTLAGLGAGFAPTAGGAVPRDGRWSDDDHAGGASPAEMTGDDLARQETRNIPGSRKAGVGSAAGRSVPPKKAVPLGRGFARALHCWHTMGLCHPRTAWAVAILAILIHHGKADGSKWRASNTSAKEDNEWLNRPTA